MTFCHRAFGASVLVMLLISLAGSAMAAETAPVCKVQKVVELPVTMIGARPTVPVTVNGQPGRFMIDSGAFFNTMSSAAADKFHLKPAEDARISGVIGVGGFTKAKVANVHEFGLADVVLPRIELIIADGMGSDIDGVIGENVLHTLDVEYDFANGVVRIYKPEHCGSQTVLAYWAETGLNVLNLDVNTSDVNHHIVAHGQLNGRDIRVMLDTGASRSYVTLKAAAAAGVTPESPGVVSGGQTVGFGSRRIDTWIARFDKIKLDGEEIQHTRLRFGGIELSGAEMILGSDFFLSHRIYVANSQNRLYFTYNGGQVFQLESTPQIQRAEAAAIAGGVSKPAETAQAATDLKDADALARRGAASIARFDYLAAIADYTRAIALKPEDGGLRLQRGLAYLRTGNRALAKADFDAAAMRIPITSRDSLNITGAYQGLGLLRESIDHANLWIDANPRSDLMAQALNSRGYARARLRTELDAALADCNGALKLVPGNPHFLDSRAYTHFVRGEFDAAIADYDIILKQTPKASLPLYSRGAIKLRKGQKDAGNADIVAAVALDPQVAARAQPLGLTP